MTSVAVEEKAGGPSRAVPLTPVAQEIHNRMVKFLGDNRIPPERNLGWEFFVEQSFR
jgi:hypothetical protein